MSHPSGRLRISLLLWLCCVAPAAASPWASIPSDRTPDPAVKFGTLPNGLRYVIRPNGEPRNRVSLRLLVAAGSLVERDDECGLAHFIEHMAFRGTQAYPGNSLITSLERRGIGLGPDNTAFTSYDYTVYHLELPDTRPETLRLGLAVFREYAAGLTFPAEAIEKERGVVLSEKDTRNTPQERLFDANLWSIWPKSRHARRSPIGNESSIRHFTRDQFVAFYNAWYRPERLAVIVVGDIDPGAVASAVAEVLGPLAARGPPREEPSDLVPARAAPPDVDLYVDRSLSGVRFNFTHPVRRPHPPDTHAERVASLHRALAFAMFRKRLEWATRRSQGSYVAPSVTTDTYMPGWEAVSFSASGTIDHWAQLAADLEQEHRRAYLLGFTEDELRLAKETLASGYEEAVRSAPTRRSEYLAAELGGCLLYGGLPVTPESSQRDLAADLTAATLDDCARAFRSAWTGAPPHVLVTTNAFFPGTRQGIGRVLNQSRSVQVRLAKAVKPVPFAYTSFGSPGKLVRDDYAADLDTHLGRFQNGVRLNFKPTPFEADTVSIVVRVGTGKLSQPADLPGLDLLAAYGFINGGLRRHSSEELDALLASHVLSVQFGVEPDALVFQARCARRELPLALQVITAYLMDPAYRPDALAGTRASLGTLYSTYEATSGGTVALQAERELSGPDQRTGLPREDAAFARTFGELDQWLKPQFRHGAIELSIVGDATWAEATAAVAPTLGALRKRDPLVAADADIGFVAPPKFPRLISLNSSLRQTAIAWYWPVSDLTDVHRERRCRLLAAVLGDLLFTRVREELGATYTPAADFVQYDGWPHFSYFTLRADVDTAQGLKVAQVIRREIERIAEKGIDEDVFLRAQQPFLRSREEDLRSNSYWGYTVLRDAQLRPERLAAARDREADTAAITRPELEALARRYLVPARGFLFIGEPGLAATWGQKYLWDAK